jgi:hypothetical protein
MAKRRTPVWPITASYDIQAKIGSQRGREEAKAEPELDDLMDNDRWLVRVATFDKKRGIDTQTLRYVESRWGLP